MPTVRWLWPLLADFVCVLALAVGGRSSHNANDSAWVVLAIMWPFALAAGLAHLWLTSRGWRARRVWPEGAIVLAVTYVLGMILRAVSGRGLAPGFLVVAGTFLALTMLGWRGLVQLGPRLRAARAP
jgi:hypothetical protein